MNERKKEKERKNERKKERKREKRKKERKEIVAKALDGQRYPLPLCEYM